MSFYADIKVAAQSFRLTIPREFSRTRGGVVIPSLSGFPYWSGEAALIPAHHADAGAAEVGLMRLDRPGQTFLVFDKRLNGPRADPGGVAVAGSSPVLAAVAGNNQSVRISGLPAGYQISVGDYLGWTNADGTLALHRAAASATGTGTGLTPLFEVEPLVRPGTSTGLAVELVRPAVRAVVVDSDYGNARPLITEGATFSWQQTNR